MTLYGVGLGPGDPGLVTVRGREAIEAAEVVFAPGDLAADLAKSYVASERIERLSFPMTRDETALREAWAEAAETVTQVARDGTAAFVTIGDPNIYSTFSHLERSLEQYLEVAVETVPGVSVVTAFTSAMDLTIENGPLDVREARAGVPEDADQVLLLKVTDVPETHQELTAAGYSVTYGRRLFMPNGTVTTDPTTLDAGDYFTVAYATRGRSA
ncbi:MAG: cobalt-factor II C(20)-methyltransferase [Halodesulfurarchaeum sp.]